MVCSLCLEELFSSVKKISEQEVLEHCAKKQGEDRKRENENVCG